MKPSSLALAVIVAALSIPSTSEAADGKVANLRALRYGKILVSLEGTPDLCSNASNKKIAFAVDGTSGTTVDGVRNMLSVLTAAKLSGKTVRLATMDNPGGDCIITEAWLL